MRIARLESKNKDCVNMINKPLISIITPTYNHEDFICQCIDSVLSQDYQNWEQIIIDDGSTDSTEKQIAKYNDKRIIYIKQKNKGISNLYEIYNKALEKSKGQLIAILEGDDFWPKDKLSKQLISFKDPEVVLSWGDAYVTNKNGDNAKIFHRNIFKPNESIPKTIILKKMFLLTGFIPACTVMCKKNALLEIGGFKQPKNSPCVDRSTWLHLANEGKFYYLDEILGYWRRHGEQITSNKKIEMLSANGHYSCCYFNSLPQNQKDQIGIKIKDIHNKNKKSLSSAYFYMGRVALYQQNWKPSRKNFKYSFITGTISLKIKSIIGVIFSYLKINFEGIAKILNIPQLKDLY